MNQEAFDFNEFIKKPETPQPEPEKAVEEEEAESAAPELDVQKAVVESLAADKASLDEEIGKIRERLAAAENEVAGLKAENASLKETIAQREAGISELNIRLAAREAKEIDQQERNPNALALLDREVELPDRFPGETRDHVLEVIKEAREKAEADGRLRRAQILESVLVANEPNGNLAKRRAELEKLFADNGNIVSGPVLNELQRLGISHKNGEEYLLPSEILKRTY